MTEPEKRSSRDFGADRTAAASSDRRVHAESQWLEVVRYNRRGHWYIESKLTNDRRRVPIAEAVQVATNPGLEVHLGLPGGGTFDSKVRDATV